MFEAGLQQPIAYVYGYEAINTSGLAVWWGEGHPLNFATHSRDISNDMLACIRAIRIALANNMQSLTIKTSKPFILYCMGTNGLNGEVALKWKFNDYTKIDGSTVESMEQLIELDEVCEAMQYRVTFELVSVDEPGIRVASSMASDAAERARIQLITSQLMFKQEKADEITKYQI